MLINFNVKLLDLQEYKYFVIMFILTYMDPGK